MTNKKKRLARELSKKTGMSHQAAVNALNASGEATPPRPPGETFAANRRAFRAESLTTWSAAVRAIAASSQTLAWRSPSDIASVLARLGAAAPLNHCFLPDSGGLDLSGAILSDAEPGCIEVHFEGGELRRLVRPAELTLVRPAHDPLDEWAYFRLECAPLAPTRPYDDDLDFSDEELVEVEPGRYVDRSHWDVGSYGVDDQGDDIPLPSSARLITRQLRGTFAIFAKGSAYNSRGAYDGYHAWLNAREFAKAIQLVVDRLVADGGYGQDPLLQQSNAR